MSWKVNTVALQEACDFLGIKRPVRIVPTAMKHALGRYHGLGRTGPTSRKRVLHEPVHHITVAADLGPQRASRTILHELTHAAQCERYDTGDHLAANAHYDIAYTAQANVAGLHTRAANKWTADDLVSYGRIAFEREAIENEALVNHFPVAMRK